MREDIKLLREALLANQKVFLILHDASTHKGTKELIKALMDANTRALGFTEDKP